MNFMILITSGWSTPSLTYYPKGDSPCKPSLVLSFLKWELVIEWGRGL